MKWISRDSIHLPDLGLWQRKGIPAAPGNKGQGKEGDSGVLLPDTGSRWGGRLGRPMVLLGKRRGPLAATHPLQKVNPYVAQAHLLV